MPRPRHPKLAEWYSNYLDSPAWSTKRNRIILARGKVCQDCGKRRTRGLTLHHITYARVTQERDTDLRILCNKCHRTAHRWHDIPYLFLCYRENWDEIKVILGTAADDPDFTYPKPRKK